MTKEKLIEDLKKLFSIIEDARYSYDIWQLVVIRKGELEYADVIGEYADFFQPVAKSVFALMVVSLYKIYEPKDAQLSFKTILKMGISLKIVNWDSDNKLKRNLKEADLLWKKICIIRSNLLAHRCYKMTIQEIAKKADLTLPEIKRLIELSIQIFNTFWISLGEKPKGINEYTSIYTSRILGILKRELPNNRGSGISR